MPRITKAQKLAKLAEDAAKNAAHQQRIALRNLAWRVAWGRHMPQAEAYAFVQQAEEGAIELPKDEAINEELTRIAASLRLHLACRAQFISTGRATYRDDARSNYCIGKDKCEQCAQPLLCGGEAKPHAFRELTQAECRDRGIYHGGRAYHVSICTTCEHVSAVDSSD